MENPIEVKYSRRDPVTGDQVAEQVVVLMTSMALAIAAIDSAPLEDRTAEAVMCALERNICLLAESVPEEIMLPARSLCFHVRNQMEMMLGDEVPF